MLIQDMSHSAAFVQPSADVLQQFLTTIFHSLHTGNSWDDAIQMNNFLQVIHVADLLFFYIYICAPLVFSSLMVTPFVQESRIFFYIYICAPLAFSSLMVTPSVQESIRSLSDKMLLTAPHSLVVPLPKHDTHNGCQGAL
jgi:hypothetical protein